MSQRQVGKILPADKRNDLLALGKSPLEVLGYAVLKRALADLETGRYTEYLPRKPGGNGPRKENRLWRIPLTLGWFKSEDCLYWCDIVGMDGKWILELAQKALEKRRNVASRGLRTVQRSPGKSYKTASTRARSRHSVAHKTLPVYPY